METLRESLSQSLSEDIISDVLNENDEALDRVDKSVLVGLVKTFIHSCAVKSKRLHLLDLPKELLAYIFQFLNEKDLWSASQVSKEFRAIAKDPYIWRELTIYKHYPAQETADFVQRAANLRSLVFKNEDLEQPKRFKNLFQKTNEESGGRSFPYLALKPALIMHR